MVGWGRTRQGRVPETETLSHAVAVAAYGELCLAAVSEPPEKAPPLITGPKLIVGTADVPLRTRILASPGSGNFEAEGLPAGLSLDPQTGWLTGTADRPGVYPVVIRAANTRGLAEMPATLLINAPLPGLELTKPVLSLALGQAVEHPLKVINPPLLDLTASGLPPDLYLDREAAVIRGRAVQPGDFPVTLSLSNRFGSASTRLTMEVKSLLAGGSGADEQTKVPQLTNVVALSGSLGRYGLALLDHGRVIGWGSTNDGRRNIPAHATNQIAVSAGERHGLGVTESGYVLTWGNNSMGQSRPPAGLSNVVAVAAGRDHSLALTAEGRVVGWGNNMSGESTPPDGLSNVVAIAAGYFHNLALTPDGRVVGWGLDDRGQATPPAGLESVRTVAAGGYHSLALTASGQVVAWGDNEWGQSQVPEGLSRVVAIAAGEAVSLAWTEEGRLVVWGRDAGQFTGRVPERPDLVVWPVAHAEHVVAGVVPAAAFVASRLWVRFEEDRVLVNWLGGRGPFRLWQSWDLRPGHWTPWGGWRAESWAAFPAEPDQQFLRLESR